MKMPALLRYIALVLIVAFTSAPSMAAPKKKLSPQVKLTICVQKLKRSAIRAGVKKTLVKRAFSGVKYQEKIVRFSRSQPEYKTLIWDYMAFLVDDARIARGRAMMKRHKKTLRAIEKKYGIDKYILTALWGIESDYGRKQGGFFIPHALANVICVARRAPRFFTKELIQALKLVSRGDLKLKDLNGSWAGAFGQTQFMPSTYKRLAVDFDGDGRRDLVHSVPDALASAANFLKKSGWRTGQTWGFEVRLPKKYHGPRGRKRRARLGTWHKRKLTYVSGRTLVPKKSKGKNRKTRAGLLLPAGRKGPAFLVFGNFSVLYSYNNAEAYALAISHLADRLRGRRAFVTAWPTNDPGLSRKQRLEVQKRLIKRGYKIGKADGRIGPVTIAAIRKVQKKLGMKPTGRPSKKILEALAKPRKW